MDPDVHKSVQPSRHHQFSLVQLLSLIAAVACVLGLWRLLSTSVAVAVVAAALGLPFFWRPRWLYVWLIPLMWMFITWISFHHPGDEYGLFAVGALAGIWSALVLPMPGNIHSILPYVLLTGSVTLGIFAAAMDKLRVPWVAWFVIWSATTAFLFWLIFSQYPSAERALAKNGSYASYISSSSNVAIYVATVATLFGTGIYRAGKRFYFRDRRTP